MTEKGTCEESERPAREPESIDAERRKAEKALGAAEEEHRLTLDGLLVGLVVHDSDTRVLSCNPRAEDILGLSFEQMSGKKTIDPAWNFVADDMTVMPVEAYPVSRVIATRQPLRDYVLGVNRPDREDPTWALVNATPMFSGEGELEKVIVNFIDITARRNMEEAARRNAAMQEKMFANIGDVIVIVDCDGIIRYKSANIEKLFGWKPEEVVGTGIWDNVHPDDHGAARGFFEEVTGAPGNVGATECRYRCRDGSYKWIRLTGTNLIHDPDIGGLLGNFHDITLRRQTEESLRESEARFKALHNASFGGIAIHDKGVILDCNNGLAEMTGYSVAELIGMDGLMLIAEESRDSVLEKIVSGYEEPYEATGRRKNGEEYPIRLEARNIPYKGKAVRVVEFRDITQQKQAEADRELLQAQFLQAQKMESVGRLAAGVAHDFDNLLTVIIGYSELAADRLNPGDPLHGDLTEILAAARRSTGITQQLLSFSRQQPIMPRLLMVNDAVEGMLNMLQRLIGEDIELEWHPGEHPMPIRIDPSQLDQILVNLCVNARDAISDVGRISIESHLRSFSDNFCADHAGWMPGDFVVLSVSDDGCGMDKLIQEHIFEPFFTTKEVGEGTGLGLATVYGIVQQNNGFIHVDSEPDQGTTFSVYVPLDQTAEKIPEKGSGDP